MAIKTFTTGEVLTAADTNTYLANSGLVFIKSDTITSGSSKEITGVFSSTYKNYMIKINNFNTTNPVGLSMRVGPASNNTGYYFGGVVVSFSTTAVSGEAGNNISDWSIGAVGTGTAGSSTIEIFSPFETTQTSYTSSSSDSRVGGAGCRNYSGFQNNSNSYSSFTLLIGAHAFLSCNVDVYGYRIP